MAHRGYVENEVAPVVFFWQEPVQPDFLDLRAEDSDMILGEDRWDIEERNFRNAMRFENSKAGRIAKRVRYLHFIIPRTTGTESWDGGHRDWYENSDPVYMKLVAPIRAKAAAEFEAHWAAERNAMYFDDRDMDEQVESDRRAARYEEEMGIAMEIMPEIVRAWMLED